MSIATASLLPDPPGRRHDEETLGRSVAQYLRWAVPLDCTWTHIPLGGQRHSKAAARMAGQGAHAGWPDYILIWRGLPLCIELKAPGGHLSMVQREQFRKLNQCGCPVFVCRSVADVQTALQEVGMPLSAKVLAA